jgi:DNA-binding MarR family transcriptional regulator
LTTNAGEELSIYDAALSVDPACVRDKVATLASVPAYLKNANRMPRKNIDASVTDFAHAVGLLLRRVRATATAERLSMTEAIVISRLATEGPTTTAELARLEGMRPQSMRATVSALDKMGIVERRAHPTDGRQVLIALTRHGVELRKASPALSLPTSVPLGVSIVRTSAFSLGIGALSSVASGSRARTRCKSHSAEHDALA